jgi:hypothetical protein
LAAVYCGACGQAKHDHSRSLGHMVRELLEHHLLLDSKTMRTLSTLLFRPGRLTRAYIEGRRVRYVSPLRLYLFSTIVFFLLLWASGLALFQIRGMADLPELAGITLGDPDDIAADRDPAKGPQHFEFLFLEPPHLGTPIQADPAKLKLGRVHPAVMSFIQRLLHGYDTMQAQPRALNPVFDEWLPRLLILLLPIVTFWLALFGRKRGLYLVDHLAFALHGQTMAVILAIAAILIRLAIPQAPLALAMFAITLVWTLLAYRTVYRSSWLGTIIKVGIIGSLYVTMLATGLVGLVIWGIATISA